MLMMGKRTHPMLVRMSELLVLTHCAGFSDAAISLKCHLDFKIQLPRGLKSYDNIGGVGLGIVVALEKSNNGSGHKILVKYARCSPSSNQSNPIPVSSGKNCERVKAGFDKVEMDSLEDYTHVTIHGPNESYTKVHYNVEDHEETVFNIRCEELVADNVSLYPTLEFLNTWNLCQKRLLGKDIYMYRGEKAFCSLECRSRQIMIDKRKEQCRSATDVSSSSYTTSPIFSLGILAI
ncbi:hypothetical protein K2173_017334 [Erythroxylum novogranatense]|uniref:FLZ-type domain-containing protein n=1 Tax=Erythroxylum novogranatense TaxID=1862640 RepID=A0AAV8TK83_9ROSI|nr:hypothetical protein K2173_017334 [Erythroxylum novogranatense]